MSTQKLQTSSSNELTPEPPQPFDQPAPATRRKKGLRGCTRLFRACIPCHKKKRVDLDSEVTHKDKGRPDERFVNPTHPQQNDRGMTLIDDSKKTSVTLQIYRQGINVYRCCDDFSRLYPPTVLEASSVSGSQQGSSALSVLATRISIDETALENQNLEHQRDLTVQKVCMHSESDGDAGYGTDQGTTTLASGKSQCSDGTLSSKQGSIKKAFTGKYELRFDSSSPLVPSTHLSGGHRVPSTQMGGGHRRTELVPEVSYPSADVQGITDARNRGMDASEISSSSSLNKTGNLIVQNTGDGSLVMDVKQTVSAVSSLLEIENHLLLQANASHANDVKFLREKLHIPPRQRQKYIAEFYMPRSTLLGNSAANRNNSFPRPSLGLVFMQTDSSDYCHPQFSAETSRLNTFQRSTERHRKGFESAELSRVGWYFNGRAIITFCCGMEMPQNPRGEPLDIHRGLSPQCAFAQRVRTCAELDYDRELEAAEKRLNSLAVTGAAAELSTPVQCSEDPYGQFTFASDAFEDGRQDMFVGHQETRPGQQWEGSMDFTLNFSLPVQDSYRDHLVTNRTPTAAEVWQPFSGISDEPNEQATSASGLDAGRMTARPTSTGEQNNAMRLLRSLNEADSRRSPIPFDEQMDMMGGPLSDGDRPRHRQFAFPSVRIWTYEGWPQDHPLTPTVLVDAGLFYAGYGDCVLCFSCGIGLRHWLPMDNPWIEHARWRPSCYYVRSIQGPEFVEVAVEMARNNRHPSYEEVKLEANRRRRAAEEDTSNIPTPQDEPELDLLCKACYTNEMCMVLMPCRHLALCQRCSGRVFACPICRARIESTFQARFD